jgi:hypothetical protein
MARDSAIYEENELVSSMKLEISPPNKKFRTLTVDHDRGFRATTSILRQTLFRHVTVIILKYFCLNYPRGKAIFQTGPVVVSTHGVGLNNGQIPIVHLTDDQVSKFATMLHGFSRQTVAEIVIVQNTGADRNRTSNVELTVPAGANTAAKADVPGG